MNKKGLRSIFRDISKGILSVDDALGLLKDLPYKDLGYAMVDHHRSLRGAHPETIFAKGKSIEQIIGIASELLRSNSNIMVTKASLEVYQAVKTFHKDLKYYKEAEIIVIKPRQVSMTNTKILIMTAGTSDIRVGEEAAVTAETMGNTVDRLYDVGVCGLHRLLYNRDKIESSSVVIVVAGMDGALPSVVAGLSNKLIIAVPTSTGYGSNLFGLAPLLTMLNSCSNGVVVVNIDNGYGAGYSAAIVNKIANLNAT